MATGILWGLLLTAALGATADGGRGGDVEPEESDVTSVLQVALIVGGAKDRHQPSGPPPLEPPLALTPAEAALGPRAATPTPRARATSAAPEPTAWQTRGAPARPARAEAGGTSFSGSLHTLSAQQRLQRALPISWVHVPKTGSLVMNAVMGLPGACLSSPKNVQDRLCSEVNPDCDGVVFMIRHGVAVRSTMRTPKSCPGIARWCWHRGFDLQYRRGHKGHGLAMLRQPEQRLLAGYYNPGDHHGWRQEWGEPASIRVYAEAVQGVGVKILTRTGDHYWVGPPSEAETLEAVKRLREGFAFVGITDETELSVCLLHATFGGECEPWEFGHWHSSPHKNASGSWDVRELEGFRDVGDRALFAEAMRIFRENLGLYGASRESCLPCFRRGGVPQEQVARIGQFAEAWDPAM